jgi:hypothetical protein
VETGYRRETIFSEVGMRIVKLFIAAAIPFVLLGCPESAKPDPTPKAASATPAASAGAPTVGSAAPAKSGGW